MYSTITCACAMHTMCNKTRPSRSAGWPGPALFDARIIKYICTCAVAILAQALAVGHISDQLIH